MFLKNIQSAVVLRYAVSKSLNSLVVRKYLIVVSPYFIRPVFASKPLCNVSSKLLRCKVAFAVVFKVAYVSSKPIKSKVACKPTRTSRIFRGKGYKL